MKFDQYPEPYVDGTTVRNYLGDVSSVTLWRWCQLGCPYHLARNGKRMYKLSEVEAWYFESKSGCTATPAASGGGTEDVA
jgi:hypothetical protein